MLILVIVGSVLAIGSVHVPVLLVVACAATLCASLAILGGGSLTASPFVWVLLGLLAFTLLQALPLPWSLAAKLAPRNAEIWSSARELFGQSTQVRTPISLDPGATLVEALKLWTYLCVLVAASATAARRGATGGALLLFGSALLLALATIAHGLTDATRVFGIYLPHTGGQGFRVAPLINQNNLAGYLSLGVGAGLALLATERPPIPRWLTAVALTPIVGMCVLTGSRAGLGALVLTVGLTGWLLRPRPHDPVRQHEQFKQFATVSSLAIGVSLVLAFAVSGRRLSHLLFDDSLAKLDLARASLGLVQQFPWLGVGRGAFESTFPALHAAKDNGIYTHPESFPIQWASEWGLPLTLVLVLALLLTARLAKIEATSSRARCALLAALVAVVAQNLFDLGFEVPGLAIALVVTASFALRDSSRGRSDPSLRRKRAVAVTAGLILVGGTLCLLVFHNGRQTLTLDREDVRQGVPPRGPAGDSATAFFELVRDATLRHPAEPYFARMAALAAWRTGQNPLPWLNWALQRGLSAGRTHYLLGSYLAARGVKSQALLELRLAAILDPALQRRIAGSAARLTQDVAELSSVAPEGAEGSPMLLLLASQLPKEHELARRELLSEAVRRDPQGAKPRLRLLAWYTAALGSRDTRCAEGARAECLAIAEQQLKVLNDLQPGSAELAVQRARFLIVTARPVDAVRTMDQACPQASDQASCLRVWLDAASAARDGAALTRIARLIQNDSCSGAKGCSGLLWSLGEVAATLGNAELALGSFEASAARESSAARWRAVAEQSRRLGYPGRALRALERALALAPGDATLLRERNAARQRALSAVP